MASAPWLENAAGTYESLDHFLEDHMIAKLTRWDLSGTRVSTEDMEKISAAVLSSNVDTLFLTECELDDDHADILANMVTATDTLSLLHLGRNSFGTHGISILAEALARADCTIALIWLKSNHFNLAGTQVLSDRLIKNSSNSTLTSLDVFNNDLGPQGIKVISDALKENNVIVRLYIGANNAGVLGASYLADMLEHNITIGSLSMDLNHIQDEGAAHLARALAVNKTLRRICLKFNEIHEHGHQALFEALVGNVSLKGIVLGHGEQAEQLSAQTSVPLDRVAGQENHVGTAGALALAALLCQEKEQSRLQHLNLVNCALHSIGHDAEDCLASAFEKNELVASLQLDQLGEAATARIAEAVNRNRMARGHADGYQIVPSGPRPPNFGRAKRCHRERIKVEMQQLLESRRNLAAQTRELKLRRKELFSALDDQRDPDFYDEEESNAINAEIRSVSAAFKAHQAEGRRLKEREEYLREAATNGVRPSPSEWNATTTGSG